MGGEGGGRWARGEAMAVAGPAVGEQVRTSSDVCPGGETPSGGRVKSACVRVHVHVRVHECGRYMCALVVCLCVCVRAHCPCVSLTGNTMNTVTVSGRLRGQAHGRHRAANECTA